MMVNLLHLPQPVLVVLAAIAGACVGSFLTLVTYRLPREQRIGLTRSRCPQCEATLGAQDLVPIFSWLRWGGKCRQCRTPVSARYPLTELACALGAMGIVAIHGATLEAVALIGLWWCVVAIVVTDLEHYIILDEVQVAAALLGVLYVAANHSPWQHAAWGAAAGIGVGLALKYGFIYFCQKDGLGMGDVKFLGVAGLWLSDAANFIPFLFFSGLFGIVSGLAWRWLCGSERFPFGPALAFALLLCVFLPQAPNGFWQLYGVLR